MFLVLLQKRNEVREAKDAMARMRGTRSCEEEKRGARRQEMTTTDLREAERCQIERPLRRSWALPLVGANDYKGIRKCGRTVELVENQDSWEDMYYG